MNTNRINRLIKTKVCRDQVKRFEMVYSNQPAIINSMIALEGEIEYLDHVHRLQKLGTIPASKGKLGNLEVAVSEALWLAGVLFSYAEEVRDFELRDVADLTPTDFRAGREEDWLKVFQTLVQKATDIGPIVLSEYGLDSVKLSELTEIVEGFSPVLLSPRKTRTELKAMNAQVPARFKRIRRILMRQLRNLIAPYKVTNPEFWAAFEASLTVYDTRASRKSGKGKGSAEGSTDLPQ